MKMKSNKDINKVGFLPAFFTTFGVIALFLVLLILGVYLIFFNQAFYNASFSKYDVQANLGVDTVGLKTLRDGIIYFFMLFRKSLQSEVLIHGTQTVFYTDDELTHMADVKQIFVVFLIVIIIAFIVFGAVLVYLLTRKNKTKYQKAIGIQMIIVPSVFLVLLSVIGISILVDWDATFVLFHKIFFPQGNWSFGWDSLMLKLLPEGIFFDGAILIAINWLLATFLMLSGGIVLLVRGTKISRRFKYQSFRKKKTKKAEPSLN